MNDDEELAGLLEQVTRQQRSGQQPDFELRPTANGADRNAVKLPAVDSEKLRAIIGDAVEESKANDPAELKKRIAELEQDIRDHVAADLASENATFDAGVAEEMQRRAVAAAVIAERERLSVEESDRVVRLARVQALAEDVFGDPGKANRWLRERLGILDGKAPLELALTEAGTRLIEQVLAKIDWGAAA